jgi:hypothetical protein
MPLLIRPPQAKPEFRHRFRRHTHHRTRHHHRFSPRPQPFYLKAYASLLS